jgi:hypothetical protein
MRACLRALFALHCPPMRALVLLWVFTGLALAALVNEVSIKTEGQRRILRSNGIADHPVGQFPNRGNPNRISAQAYEFTLPLKPVLAAQPQPAAFAFFGVAINGVPFEAGTGEFWNGNRAWNYEAKGGAIQLGLDENDAHVQPGGQYHYHALPKGLMQRFAQSKGMNLIGWAADGFPIYDGRGHQQPMEAGSPLQPLRSSWQLKTQNRPGGNDGPGGKPDGSFTADWEYVKGSGDLDECNGRVGVTPEFPQGTYHYQVTASFPFLPRFWRGEPDASFRKKGPPPGGAGPRRGRRGGPGFGPSPFSPFGPGF